MNDLNNKYFKNKILLITGGTGSFGKALIRNVPVSIFKEIRIFSRDELKQDEMRNLYSDKKIKFYVGDVRDYSSIDSATKNVDYIFHAAALKQVPSCEFYPLEAIKTNILGSENVMKAAINNNIKKCVMLSTDKAVYPINSMGMTKALMEKVMISKLQSNIDKKINICATRYGNVMASRGSVIPLFVDQILQKKDITITNPKMTRFMMSLDESVELVFHAFKHGQMGEIFVPYAPASNLIILAKSLIKIFNSKSKIKYIGTRHGEKLFETLISSEEMFFTKKNSKYYKILSDNRDLNYNKYFNKGQVTKNNLKSYNSHNTKQLNQKQLIDSLIKLPFVKNLIND
jgi:UDP-N-acetylglucosamine 4,6-dehydratase/5-epimerase